MPLRGGQKDGLPGVSAYTYMQTLWVQVCRAVGHHGWVQSMEIISFLF